MKTQDQKDLKLLIEQVFKDYKRKSCRDLARSLRIFRFRNIAGATNSLKELLGRVIEKGVLMQNALPAYYFLGGFGNESMEHPNYCTYRENTLYALHILGVKIR